MVCSYVHDSNQGEYRPCERCDYPRSNCLIYIKSGNMMRKSGKYRKNYQKNWEKSKLSHGQY